MIGSFIVLAHFAGAPPARPTCRRTSRTASSCRGSDAVSARDASTPPGCARRRWRALLAALNRDGEEARVVGGAVRNALLGEPHRRHRHRHHGRAAGGDAPRRGRGLQGGADRHRARHRHGGDRRPPVRGDDACARTSRPSAATRRCVRPRLEARRRAPRLHHERAVRSRPTAPCTTIVGGLADLEARRVRFIGDAATRIAEDYLRILRFFRFHAVLRRRRARRRRPARRASRRAPGSISCRASACAWS